ncbi:hypothetical protein AC578_1591 [Pseudocercospora eumusae]|uniref:Glycosyltransferase 2-like domain-containing protein n=1 Tax=Pseudocercospora eumusae TaxID=321146 RepID=A0A139HM96_9PEZI|nr:hypothetical protein AC578_1591 [Pseudocercospora eumusae]
MDYNLFYHARKKTCVETNPKACNVNSTLQWMQQNGHPAGRAEWFAVFDCDMMPEPQFLRSLLGEAMRDPRTAMAVCPQNYYNIPTNDPLYQSMELQNTLDEPTRSSFGGTWCAGSGFLARRVAIDSIGGIPTESVCEDILCGYLLNGQGWNVVLVDLPLQWGLMPDSVESHIAQRRRWLVGSVQNGKIIEFCLGSKARGMSVPQRLAGGAYCFAPYVQCFLQPLTLLILPWIFAVSRADQPYESLWWLCFWGFFYRAVLFANIWVETKWTSRHALMQKDYSHYWLWATIAPSVVAEILPRTLGPYRRQSVPFVSSGSIQTSLSERSSRLRVPMRKRIAAILLKREYFVNTFMAINAIVSLSVLLWIDLGHIRAGSSASMVLISHSLSPNLYWERHVSFFIPILYALFPPDVPERREMMERDRKGAWRVKKEYKKPQVDRWAFMLELQVWFGLVWSAAAFLLINLH